MIDEHIEKGADMTIGCIEVPIEEGPTHGVLRPTAKGMCKKSKEKPKIPPLCPQSKSRPCPWVFTF